MYRQQTLEADSARQTSQVLQLGRKSREDRQTDRQTDRDRQKQRERKTEKERERQRDGGERERGRQTDRQTDLNRERQRQTDRETDRCDYKQKKALKLIKLLLRKRTELGVKAHHVPAKRNCRINKHWQLLTLHGHNTSNSKLVYDILPSGGRCRKAVFGV